MVVVLTLVGAPLFLSLVGVLLFVLCLSISDRVWCNVREKLGVYSQLFMVGRPKGVYPRLSVVY